MNSKLEEEFYDLAGETISKASRINCPLEDFAEGLRLIIGELKDRIAGVEEEINAE
jgi:hypothetical protein